VIILAYNLATEELFTTVTGPNATFTLNSLPNGYYDFAAQSEDGFYVGDQVANVSPLGETVFTLQLRDYSDETETERWYFPGSEEKPTGVAQMLDGYDDGPSFCARHPSAKYIIGGGGALVLAAIGGGGPDPTASPSLP